MPGQKKEYVPTHSSAGYAVLVSLYFDEQNGREYWTKEEICDLAYPKWTNTVMNGNSTKQKAVTGLSSSKDYYDGWSSVSTSLVKTRGLIEVINRKPSAGIHKRMYKLTEAGRELGRKLVERDNLDPSGPSGAIPPAPPSASNCPSAPTSSHSLSTKESSCSDGYGERSHLAPSLLSVKEVHCVDLVSDDENEKVDTLPSPKKRKVDENLIEKKGVLVFGNTWLETNILDWSHCEAAPVWYQSYQNLGSVSSLSHGQDLLFKEFDLIMFVDKREMNRISQSLDKKKELARRSLSQIGITMDIEDRSLNVGDYLWVLRHKTSKKELVLDYIIERKSYVDLWQSITNKVGSTTRYYEQKRRIVYTGIPNRYYLVEGRMSDIVEGAHTKMPAEQKMATIMSSKAQSQLEGFRLLYTVSTVDTVDKLLSLTRQIGVMMREYRSSEWMKNPTNKKIDFDELQQKAAILKRSVTQMAKSMVYQISGVGKVAAEQVLTKFSSLAELMAALDHAGDTVETRTDYLSKATGLGKEKAKRVVQVLTTAF